MPALTVSPTRPTSTARTVRHETDAGAMTVITDPESYAATEPVLAEDQTPPVSPQDTDADEHDERHRAATSGRDEAGLR